MCVLVVLASASAENRPEWKGGAFTYYTHCTFKHPERRTPRLPRGQGLSFCHKGIRLTSLKGVFGLSLGKSLGFRDLSSVRVRLVAQEAEYTNLQTRKYESCPAWLGFLRALCEALYSTMITVLSCLKVAELYSISKTSNLRTIGDAEWIILQVFFAMQ